LCNVQVPFFARHGVQHFIDVKRIGGKSDHKQRVSEEAQFGDFANPLFDETSRFEDLFGGCQVTVRAGRADQLRVFSDNFVGWTDEALEDYVMFHVEHEQLLAVESEEGIQAVIIGWPTEERQVEQFNWQDPTQHGRFWFWDQIASETPEACMICFSQFFWISATHLGPPFFLSFSTDF
jgi:hypothetical protein